MPQQQQQQIENGNKKLSHKKPWWIYLGVFAWLNSSQHTRTILTCSIHRTVATTKGITLAAWRLHIYAISSRMDAGCGVIIYGATTTVWWCQYPPGRYAICRSLPETDDAYLMHFECTVANIPQIGVVLFTFGLFLVDESFASLGFCYSFYLLCTFSNICSCAAVQLCTISNGQHTGTI